MKNPSLQKKRAQNRGPFYTKKWTVFGILIGLVILVGLGWAIVTKVQNDHTIQKQKQQFAQASQDLSTLSTNVASGVGASDDSLSYKNCSRPHEEFSKGPLGCSTGIVMLYGVENVNQANSDLLIFDGKFNAQKNIIANGTYLNGSLSFKDLSLTYQVQDKSESFRDRGSGLLCGIGYQYVGSRTIMGYARPLHSSKDQTLVIDLGCSGPAKQAYYPMTE